MRPVAAELFHADIQTDGRMDGQTGEPNSRSSQFC